MPDPDSAAIMLDAFTVVVEDGRSFEFDSSWSDAFTIRETEAVGNVATIVLAADFPTRGYSAFRSADSLFVVTG